MQFLRLFITYKSHSNELFKTVNFHQFKQVYQLIICSYNPRSRDLFISVFNRLDNGSTQDQLLELRGNYECFKRNCSPLILSSSRHLCTSLSYGSPYLPNTRTTLHKTESRQQKQLLRLPPGMCLFIELESDFVPSCRF